ncbi:MAG: hypothetical protein WBM50_13105, partial [Acidimicrobiales bacterium]
VNGHEWAKRQAERAGIAYTALANGFASCEDPDGLAQICDRFGPDDVQTFFDRWSAHIPTPFTENDRAAGYWWELSMRQVELSRTLVLDDPRRARRFFEALVADNIGIGRPDEVHAVFGRDRRGRTTAKDFRTRIFGPGTEVKMDFAYKHSRVKQYLKEGRAFRIETVINKPGDIGCLARLEHLPELIAKARAVNARVLQIERAGQGCAIGDDLFDRLHQPLTEGQRTGAFRFGDQRAMALAGALCAVVHTVTGFTNQSLRGLVAELLGSDYGANQMSYDLRKLRLHGLIEKIPGTNTYHLTSEGTRSALFYTKIRDRLLSPLLNAGHQPPAPPQLRRALKHIDQSLTDYIHSARLGTAA